MNFDKIKFNNLEKPKINGLNIVIDTGLTIEALKNTLSDYGKYIDFIKIGWGLSLITPKLKQKLEICNKFNIPVFFGGTLFEYMHVKNLFAEYIKWLKDIGINYLEISDGTIQIEEKLKLNYIEEARAKGFVVFSEIGKKSPEDIGSPVGWLNQISNEFEAGSNYVILEGRESGTAGIYRSNGEIRSGLVSDIINQFDKKFDRLIFESPNKSSQVYLIKNYGANVNLSNINNDDILPLVSLRQGLRSDTFDQ